MEQLEHSTESSDYLDAFLRLRTAKCWLMWLLLLAILGNLALCLTVRFTSLLEGSSLFQTDMNTLRPEGYSLSTDETSTEMIPAEEIPAEVVQQAASAAAQAEDAGTEHEADQPAEPRTIAQTTLVRTSVQGGAGDIFYNTLHVVLPMARVCGLFCATLLVLILLMSLKVVLLGRLRGVAYLTSAALWSIVLLVLVIPWAQAFAGFPVPSVLFGARELIESSAQIGWGAEAGWEDHLLHWMRFMGYPLLALVLWLTIQVQYARSYRPMVAGLQIDTEQ